MRLDSDDFELFALPRTFAQDRPALDVRWRALQGEVHPDRFAADGAAAQRVAMQWAVRVNEAYRRLKDPLRRAAYLCELNGAAVDAETNTAMAPAFLVRQLEWREALDAASSAAAVETLGAEVDAQRRQSLAALEALIDRSHDYAAAAREVRALMFVERFAHDVERRREALGQ